MARWVLRTGFEKVLEPSAGGGALIAAILRERERLTGRIQAKPIVAYDIDKVAIDQLRSRFGPLATVVQADFLAIEASAGDLYDAVIANPPFTRNHEIPKLVRERFDVRGAAGMWAYHND